MLKHLQNYTETYKIRNVLENAQNSERNTCFGVHCRWKLRLWWSENDGSATACCLTGAICPTASRKCSTLPSSSDRRKPSRCPSKSATTTKRSSARRTHHPCDETTWHGRHETILHDLVASTTAVGLYTACDGPTIYAPQLSLKRHNKLMSISSSDMFGLIWLI